MIKTFSRARSKQTLERQNREAISKFADRNDFTPVEAAWLLTGRDPIFWGADILLGSKPYHKRLGNSVRLYKELMRGLDNGTLRPVLPRFNGDGTYDGTRTRISRLELERFRATCGVDTAALPGTAGTVSILAKADAAAVEPCAAADQGALRGKSEATRSNILDAAIEAAKKNAEDPTDYQQVWPQLVRIADSAHPPAPLQGHAPGKGVEYEDEKQIKYFTKNALRNRFLRARKK